MDTDSVLIAGLWLPCQIWDPVVAGFAERGHRAVALPGVDRRIVVGHSSASTLAADRRPARVAGGVGS